MAWSWALLDRRLEWVRQRPVGRFGRRRGMCWEQQQGRDRAYGADAGGDEQGGAEAVEERRGRCGVDGARERGVAADTDAVGELERAAGGAVGCMRKPRSQVRGKPVGQSAVVERGVDAADDRDAEGAAEQAGG